jgi:ribosomal protein S18
VQQFCCLRFQRTHLSTLQGHRACPGKLQRRGRTGELKCHKIDLDAVSYINILTLKDYLTEDGEIQGKRETGLCAKCQRKVRIQRTYCAASWPVAGCVVSVLVYLQC